MMPTYLEAKAEILTRNQVRARMILNLRDEDSHFLERAKQQVLADRPLSRLLRTALRVERAATELDVAPTTADLTTLQQAVANDLDIVAELRRDLEHRHRRGLTGRARRIDVLSSKEKRE